MNLESKLIFIVGPGGVGKSTTGRVLAEKINYEFVDIDLVFCGRIGLIGDFSAQFGYREYCLRNSELFDSLLGEYKQKAVFALSSGFLVHEDSPGLVAKHKKILKEVGTSILLLPSTNLEESVEVVIPRLMSRDYVDTTEDRERQRHISRFPKYKSYGDVKIFSAGSPDGIVSLMMEGLKEKGFSF